MAASHFSWVTFVPGVDHHNLHIATLAASSAALILVALYARGRLGSGEKAIVPAEKFSVRGIFEGLCEFIDGLGHLVIGHGHEKYSPLFASIFVFILFNNLVGLIPGMTAATDNLNTTFALGLFSFAMYHVFGVAANKFGYIKQFTGPSMGFWLATLAMSLLLAPIEILSHVVRPFTLGLRMMGNIQGDHAVLGAFLEMVPYGVPVIFYVMGLFVSFMQAFVFTVLSMVYVSMATSHDH
jgi:F-type H+-transporting ATPase subunit a